MLFPEAKSHEDVERPFCSFEMIVFLHASESRVDCPYCNGGGPSDLFCEHPANTVHKARATTFGYCIFNIITPLFFTQIRQTNA
jgi:hypothetical protein